jgi:predicted GNAT superfamily acetyltransferase
LESKQESPPPRAIGPEDEPAFLVLNNAHAAELSLLDAAALRALLGGAFYTRCIGDLEAVLIAVDEAHPTYASPNYLWFRARYPRFIYVDRVVTAAAARGKGHARRLYADLFEKAAASGHDLIVCEINSDPPNPVSDRFHAALGFAEVGAAEIHDGAKTVRYLARKLGGTYAGT